MWPRMPSPRASRSLPAWISASSLPPIWMGTWHGAKDRACKASRCSSGTPTAVPGVCSFARGLSPFPLPRPYSSVSFVLLLQVTVVLVCVCSYASCVHVCPRVYFVFACVDATQMRDMDMTANSGWRRQTRWSTHTRQAVIKCSSRARKAM